MAKKKGTIRFGGTGMGLGSPGKATPTFKPFKPYTPPPPPTGSYDPAIDAQGRAASRGLRYLEADTAQAGERAGVDYGLDRGDIFRNQTRGNQDLDFQVEGLQRSYQQLQRRQGEGMRHAGILSGGIALLAAQKREENMDWDRRPIDTARTRLGEDTNLNLGRLDLGYQRGVIDRGTALSRARDENAFFGLDLGEQKAFQSAQSGYVPPGNPQIDGRNAKGVAYREVTRGGYVYRVDRTGKVLSRKKK